MYVTKRADLHVWVLTTLNGKMCHLAFAQRMRLRN
jgi:hypothetical protein